MGSKQQSQKVILANQYYSLYKQWERKVGNLVLFEWHWILQMKNCKVALWTVFFSHETFKQDFLQSMMFDI